MKDEVKQQFEEVIAEHNRKLEQQRQVHLAKETAEEQFMNAFADRTRTIVRPAFERIKAFLASKGLRTTIFESHERVARDGRVESREEIGLRVLLDPEDEHGYRPAHEYPHLSLLPEKHTQEVTIHQSTSGRGRSGQSGSVGSTKLEQFTDDYLDQRVLTFVCELLK
jgi:hypothetical protein